MTSLTRKWKGETALGRCLIAATSPQRQQRRISNFVPHAGVLRQPEHVSTGLALMIGSREATPIEIPGAAPWGAAFLPDRGTGGRVVEDVDSDAPASFLHLVRRPAKKAAQHFARSFCPVAFSVFGFVHGSNHGASHAREAVNVCQGFGNVCRA